MTNIEELSNRFTAEMEELYHTTKQAIKGYNPTRSLAMVREHGGVETAKKLMKKEGVSGIVTLWEEGRLDLSLEAFVIKPEYAGLFTEEEIQHCKKILGEMDYHDENTD
jgi:hypothetical protein